jgi:hypothetical protein
MTYTKYNPQSIEFDINELWLLVNKFPSTNLLGLETPYQGFLIEEIENAQYLATESLFERELISSFVDGSMKVNEEIFSPIEVLTHPDHTLIVQQGTPISKPPQQYIHFSKDTIVVHIELEDRKHQITSLPDQAALLEYLGIESGINGKDKPVGKPFNLEEEILYKAAGEYTSGNNQAGEDTLKASSLKKEDIQSLHEALSNTMMNRSFVAVKNQDKPGKTVVTGFGILQGYDNLWLLEPVSQFGKSMIHFEPVNMQTITEKLKDILPC